MTKLVVGCPVWERGWCLDAWFAAVRANVDPATTGLAFVVPSTDTVSRDIIARRSAGFAWVEIRRDRMAPHDRDSRARDGHETLAAARNQLLSIVHEAKPDLYLSWDSDLFVEPGLVEKLEALDLPALTVWTWLNRQAERKIGYKSEGKQQRFCWQPPPACTAMHWDSRRPARALHYPGSEWTARANGVWQADVVLAFTLTQPRAFTQASYKPHPDGEEILFNYALEQRGVPRFCYGERPGVHLYDRRRGEALQGYPMLMKLAKQIPLAATEPEPDSEELRALGFYPERAPHGLAQAI